MKLFGRYKKKYKKAHRIRFPKLLNYLNLTRRKKGIPLNLMVGCGNTRIITLSEAADFNFHDAMFKPYDGKVF